jgi:Fe2+ or Zn2+ uptake regulation protein
MNIQNILSDLKEKGLKNTRVRKSIIEILINSSTPLSVSEILEKLLKDHLNPNKTTIYREIEFLKKFQVLQEIDFGDGKKRYEISEDHHHHIICINCQTVSDIAMEKDLNNQEKQILKQLGFKPIGHSLEFFGLCSKCQ